METKESKKYSNIVNSITESILHVIYNDIHSYSLSDNSAISFRSNIIQFANNIVESDDTLPKLFNVIYLNYQTKNAHEPIVRKSTFVALFLVNTFGKDYVVKLSSHDMITILSTVLRRTFISFCSKLEKTEADLYYKVNLDKSLKMKLFHMIRDILLESVVDEYYRLVEPKGNLVNRSLYDKLSETVKELYEKNKRLEEEKKKLYDLSVRLKNKLREISDDYSE